MRIQVDPQQLDSSSSRIEQQVIAYEKNYQQILQIVETLHAGWQGKDNMAFSEQIKNFEQDFGKMSALMRDYAGFLKTSACVYRDTQEERAMQARSLMGR